MNPVDVGIAGVIAFVVLLILGIPVAFSMAIIGFVGFSVLSGFDAGIVLLARDIFDELSSYPLSVIPMFILMGNVAFASGISQRLYKATYTWFGSLRGGLTVATVFACSGFAAICGSTAATAATMGRIALPEMRKYGYQDHFAAGTVAAAGTLGIMIPPSTIFLVYGIMTEQSIGKLFIAGVVPGALLTVLFVLTVSFLCLRNPQLGPPGPTTTLREKAMAFGGIVEAILLFLLTIGGLFLGWFSPTQAGAIGAGGSLIIGLARRKITFHGLLEALKDGLRTSSMVLFIIAGATVFGHFMAVTSIPFALAEWVGNLSLPPMMIMAIIVFIYFIGGFFMDSMALVVITIPIFYPLVNKLSFDPIWFGVMIVLVAEMGVITPPVGVNVFVIKGIAPDIPLNTIFRGVLPFVGGLLFLAFLLMVWPQLATFLPNLISY